MGMSMPPMPGLMSQPLEAPDLSGLAQEPQAVSDPSVEFIRLAKQLEDLAMSIAVAHPKFSKAAETIKQAIQSGAADVIGGMQQQPSGGPSAGIQYNG